MEPESNKTRTAILADIAKHCDSMLRCDTKEQAVAWMARASELLRLSSDELAAAETRYDVALTTRRQMVERKETIAESDWRARVEATRHDFFTGATKPTRDQVYAAALKRWAQRKHSW